MKKLHHLLAVVLAVASTSFTTTAKVTLDDVYEADAPTRALDLSNNATHIARHSKALVPDIIRPGSYRDIGYCSGQYSPASARWDHTCLLYHDQSWFCSAAGIMNVGNWRLIYNRSKLSWEFMFSSSSRWRDPIVEWVCYKPMDGW